MEHHRTKIVYNIYVQI